MTDHEEEFRNALKETFNASETNARMIARQAAMFLEEADTGPTTESLIESMNKLPHEDLIVKWNTVIGRLNLSSWGDGSDGDNP